MAPGMDRPAAFFSAFADRPRPAAADLVEAVHGHPERERARDLLAAREPAELTAAELRETVAGNLSLLRPGAFLYFLPAILTAVLADYPALTVIASELLGELTPPTLGDVEAGYDRLLQNSRASGAGLSDETVAVLRSQALQWFNSGDPTRRFAERFSGISATEARAIFAFLCRFRDLYGADFPDGAVDKAISYWARQ
jgi:hypothetical protein